MTRRPRPPVTRRLIAPGLLAALGLLAACGDDAGSQATTTAPAAATTTAGATTTTGAPTTTSAPAPAAIISLSPTATEMLYAIGAGGQVLAVDNFSNYPAEAVAKQHGLDGFQPNVEAIAGLHPDLVVTDGTNPDFLGQLDSVEIAHWEGPAAKTFDDIYTQLEQLGAVTGHAAAAATLVAGMQADIQTAIAGLPKLSRSLTYYHELSTDYYTVTKDTFIGLVYSLAGLQNIADEAGGATAYPQLSAEYILSADPDLIFLACTKYCGESPETVAARDGWGKLQAVKNGNVFPMDDDVASRWGPRVVDYIKAVAAAVAKAATTVGS